MESPFSPFVWRDLVDVLVTAAFLWGAIAWFVRTRAFFALWGFAVLGVVYLLARQLRLDLTVRIFQGFAAAWIVLLVVVFHDDLRRFLELIGIFGLGRRANDSGPVGDGVLTRAVSHLAQNHTGALIVLPGREPIDRHVEGGVLLDGRVSEPLLLGLFDPHTPTHDGAVVIEGDRVLRFSVHLPLSSDRAQLGGDGTRHAAALGLAERCDSLAIVVSEEKGTVSVTRNATLIRLAGPQELVGELQCFRAGLAPVGPNGGSLRRALTHQWRSVVASLALAAGLWGLVVPGGVVVEVQRTAPVIVEDLPPGYEVATVNPSRVQVTLSGSRRKLVLEAPGDVQVRLDASRVQLGRKTFPIGVELVDHPPDTAVVAVSPAIVRLGVRRVGEEKKTPTGRKPSPAAPATR